MRLTDTLGQVTLEDPAISQVDSYFRELTTARLGNSAAIVLGARGEYVDANGASSGLSNVLDRRFLVQLRNHADTVVTTGATVRKEGLHFPKSGRLAVLTNLSEFDTPKVSGEGSFMRAIQASHPVGEAFSSPLEAIRVRNTSGHTVLESVGFLMLDDHQTSQKLHFEAGLGTLQKLWNAGKIQQLWITHLKVENLINIFAGARTVQKLELGDLNLDLLAPSY